MRGPNPRLLNAEGSGRGPNGLDPDRPRLGVVRDDMRGGMTADSTDTACVCDEIERVSSACDAGSSVTMGVSEYWCKGVDAGGVCCWDVARTPGRRVEGMWWSSTARARAWAGRFGGVEGTWRSRGLAEMGSSWESWPSRSDRIPCMLESHRGKSYALASFGDVAGSGVVDDDADIAFLSSISPTLMLRRLLWPWSLTMVSDLYLIVLSGDRDRVRARGERSTTTSDWSSKLMPLSLLSSSRLMGGRGLLAEEEVE